MAGEYKSETLVDFLSDFDGGVNQSRSPLKLDPNVMARAVNVTVRNDFASHRPPYQKRLLSYENNTTQSLVEHGLFQGACFYKPDSGPECLIAAISGMLFQFQIVVNTVTVKRIDQGFTQDPAALQEWLWQSENFVIWNDGLNYPVFYDGTNCFRSSAPTVQTETATTTSSFIVPPINQTVNVSFSSVTGLAVGAEVVLTRSDGSTASYRVQSINNPIVNLLNLSDTPYSTGITVVIEPSGLTTSWTTSIQLNQLPPGRMGVYGMGRNWVCLPDGRSFIASDAVGGSSGTAPLYRDSVLYITENTWLAGGGTFIVPGNVGDITAMIFAATLDVSLGQGPLQVLTSTTVFSCYAPTDRTTWQSVTNPILTESLITNGGKGQNSTVQANGDILFRSIDGIRSLILGRRDFDTWGNCPISQEVDDILGLDDPGLLRYGSAIVHDNRLLMTTHPTVNPQGVYWQGIVPLNFDPVSSLRGKQPSVYDSGIWTGINILQLVLGQFNDVERGFSFVLNTKTGSTRIELWELMSSSDNLFYDNDGENDIPIVWRVKSASLKFGQNNPLQRQLLSLKDGEIFIEDLVGTVNFWANYWPDQYPCKVPWFSWSECQSSDSPSLSQVGFRPRMGLGMPSASPCDASNNRPLREFYVLQFDIQIQGHCTLLGARFKAAAVPDREFSKQSCNPVCP